MNNISSSTHLDVMQGHVHGLFNADIKLTELPELGLKFYLLESSIRRS